MRPKVMKMIALSPLILVAVVLFVALGGEVVRLLWNWLLPPLFGWREVTFWQALGILALCRILFGGLGRGGGTGPGLRRRMRDRMEQLTPEERERFRQAMLSRCGVAPSTSESKAP